MSSCNNPFHCCLCADRFGLGQPGRMPASVNAMRVLSTSTDLEAAVADALVRGKIQNASNSGKWLKLTCTYVLLFLDSFILIVPVSDAAELPFAGLTLGILAAVCFSWLIPCHFSAAVIRQNAVGWYYNCRMGWISCLPFTWLSRMCPALWGCSALRGSEISISPVTCMKILSEKQHSLLVSIPDQVLARTSSCPVLYAPG